MKKENNTQQIPIFPNLTALRFVGAFLVFLFHVFSLGRELWGDFTQSSWFQIVAKITSKGHLGVSLFFVLSGFLITYLMLHERQKTGTIQLKKFIARRILRVWPLYFVVVLFGFFIFSWLPFGKETVHEFWRYALFLSNIDEIKNGLNDSLNFLTATWSVSVEEQFYAGWALCLALFKFRKDLHFYAFFCVIILGTLIFRTVNLDHERMLYFHTFSVVSDMAIGGLLALLAFNGKIQSFFQRAQTWKIALIYLLGCFMLFAESKIFEGFLFVFQRVFIAVFFAFMIAQQIYSPHTRFQLDHVPGLHQAGQYTYGFYLFHCIFIYYWQAIFQSLGWNNHALFFAAYFLLTFGCTLLLSRLSFNYFESPFLKLKNYFRS